MSKALKRTSVVLIAALLMIALIMTLTIDNSHVYAASSKGKITSVTNAGTGIQVKWGKDSTKKGYIIYRKVGSVKKWTKVKTISSKSTVKWLDKNVLNGQKYTYKVQSYKGNKVTSNEVSKTIYRLKTPSIKSLTMPAAGSFKVRSTENTKATGFQVWYSTSKTFTTKTSRSVSGKKLNKVFSGLKNNKTYYVKIRAYKKVGTKRYYSAWSAVKSVKIASTKVYTTRPWTRIYVGTDSETSDYIDVWYNTELTILGDYQITSDGTWKELEYNGKTYYVWVTDETEDKLTENGRTFEYNDPATTKERQEVIDFALDIYKNWDTKYDYTHTAKKGVKGEDGKYAFDCSGFASYVINTVMQKYVPAYKLDTNITKLHETDVIVNEGLSSEIKAESICKGEMDLDKLLPGDLLFFLSNDADTGEKDVNHVGIYLGDGEFIQSTKLYERYAGDVNENGKPMGGVCIAPFKGTYPETFVEAIRVIPDEIKEEEIRMVVDRSSGIGVYPDDWCTEAKRITTLAKGTEFVVLNIFEKTKSDGTTVDRAYIRYGDGEEGYIVYNLDNMHVIE